MSDPDHNNPTHLTDEALDRYQRRVLPPAALLAADEHIAACAQCFEAVRSPTNQIELPETHLSYEELEAFVDGRMSSADRELITAHTEFCGLCRRELDDLSATRDAKDPRPPRALYRVRSRT